MAWIESHQKLKDDPKVFDLMAELSWSKAETIGRLHLFWWWCVDHCEDGDLRRFNDTHLALAVELNPGEGKRLVEAFINAGFVERSPYFRVKNWWKFIGFFLKRKYNGSPSKWKKIEQLYITHEKELSYSTVTHEKDFTPNPTQPNQTKPPPPTPPRGEGEIFNQKRGGGVGSNKKKEALKLLESLKVKVDVFAKYDEGVVLEVLNCLQRKLRAGEQFKDPAGWVVAKLKEWSGERRWSKK